MVKRLLSIVMMALVALTGVEAQQLQRNPLRLSYSPTQQTASGPRKVASLDSTTIFGYSTGSDWGGLGIGQTPIAYDVAIYIPGTLKGTKVRGVNVPVIDNTMTGLTVWVRTKLEGENLGEGTTEATLISQSYVAVPLEEEVEIPAEGVYVGYSFKSGSASNDNTNYPVAYDYYGQTTPNSMFLQYSNTGWANYDDQFPASALQVFLGTIQLPDYDISFTAVGQTVQTPGATYSVPITFISNSANSIQSLDVDVTLEGQTSSQHIVLTDPVEAGIRQSGAFTLTGTAPAETGRFDLALTVKKVNGVDYEGDLSATTMLKNLTKIVARRTVIEEFTGTGCGWCPRGWVGMEYMKANHPNDFIGIAFHKYNQTDPLYPSTYPMLGLTGAPGCVIDRKEEADPYYGNGNDDLGIEVDFKRLNAELPEVDVNVSAQWNEEQTEVDITADVEFLITPGSVSLVYVLTADSLRGTTTSWRQGNYYYQYTAAQVGNAPGISDFCKGGQYGTSYVYLTFNDAVIGSSYASTTNNKGQTIDSADGYEAGSTFQGSYTISQPSSTAVRDVLRKDLVTAVVLVVDNESGYILNAAKTRVSLSDAVTSVRTDGQGTEVARYNAAGLRLTAPQRGINLIRMSDGSVRKVTVK